MAVWHFKFALVPEKSIRRAYGPNALDLAEYKILASGPVYGEADRANLWDGADWLPQIAGAASTFLPEIKSWSDDARMFEDNDTNRIEVWSDSVACRINMTKFSRDLLAQFLEIAERFDCKIIVIGSGRIVDPDMKAIAEHIVISAAYKFCRNPVEYLKNLGEKSGHPEE